MRMTTEELNDRLLARWVRATAWGWLMGFALVVGLAMLWDLVGGGAQFMVGVGMGAGVGYMQARVVSAQLNSTRAWLWTSVVGMGIPFVLWDLSPLVGLSAVFSMPLCVVSGSLLVGILQRRLLRPCFDRASWWIPACVVGWGVPVGIIGLGDVGLLSGPGSILSLLAMFFGGVVLGAVTGKALVWIAQCPTAPGPNSVLA